MTPRYDTVSFLSDFGSEDEFVGVVKAVLRGLAPHAAVVDLTHGIPAFDVRAGGLALARAAQYLPPGVVLAVVDPGVGTDRRAVAIEAAGGEVAFVGPDNGLLASAVAMLGGAERAVALTNTELQLAAPGATFAARDVFAPAAAHLANGGRFEELGPEVDVFSLLPGVLPVAERKGDEVETEVLWVDRFGNAQLNVGPDDLEGMGDRLAIRFAGTVRAAVRATTYGAVGSGVGLVVDAYGLLSVCLDRQSAAAELGLDVGDRVVVTTADDRAVTVPVTMRTGPR
ncbi:MAG: S-adenosyl-l-methionine hydroxide adenosyltransferase family protein [Acidimicrobiia bacterium]